MGGVAVSLALRFGIKTPLYARPPALWRLNRSFLGQSIPSLLHEEA